MLAADMRDNQTDWRWYFLVLFLALCEFKILSGVHAGHIKDFASAAYGVIEGRPQWLAYQNRLLGPYLVLLISKTGLNYERSLIAYHLLLMLAHSALMFFLLRRMHIGVHAAISYLVATMFGFLALQHRWFFTWDSIDLILFTCLAYALLARARLWVYLTLFGVGIINRESALLIALCICIDAFEFDTRALRMRLADLRKFILGICLIAGGAVYTHFIRRALFISKADGTSDAAHAALGNHVNFVTNVQDLFIGNFRDRNFIYSIAIFATLIYFLRCWRQFDDRQFKCLLMMLALLANIMVFGIITETRMLFIFIPFVLFLILDFSRSQQGTRLAGVTRR